MNFPKGIKVRYTIKQFYKSYSYRICFKVDEEKLVYSKVSRGWYGSQQRSNLLQLRRELKYTIFDHLPDSLECKFRGEGKYVTLYLNDDSVFKDTVSKLSYCIEEVSIPTNENHKQVMEDNHRVRVRQKLFHNKYRFKVNIKNTWNDRFTDFEKLHSWLHNLENPAGDRWMANIPLARIFKLIDQHGKNTSNKIYWSSYGVYLNDDQDVMMLQMWLHNYYDSAEKAVLISEL